MPLTGQGRVRPAVFTYIQGEVSEEHVHEEHQLVYASKGLLVVDTADGRWVVPPLRAVWVPARIQHEVSARIESTMSTLYINAEIVVRGLGGVTVVAVSPLLRELILHITTASLTQSAHDRVEALLLDQLEADPAAPLKLPVLHDSRIRAIADRLEADPTDSRTLRQLGHDVGASERTLQRLFRSETGTSFGRWRTQLRLQHGVIELGKGASVTAAASNSGYSETSAFIQAFRNAFGTTPGAYFRRSSRPT